MGEPDPLTFRAPPPNDLPPEVARSKAAAAAIAAACERLVDEAIDQFTSE